MKKEISSYCKPVIFFFNGYGDTIINLPALRALTHIFHDKLTLVCGSEAQNLCYFELKFQKIVEVDFFETTEGRVFDHESTCKSIGECDLFMSLTPWHSNSITSLIECLRPELSIGYFEDFLISLPLNYSKNAVDLAFDLPQLICPSIQLQSYIHPPNFSENAMKKVKVLMKKLPNTYKTLIVHTDSSPEKMWEFRKFIYVLDQFIKTLPNFVILAIGRTPEKWESSFLHNVVIPCYGLPLEMSMSLVSQADLFLGIDSCMLHVADFYRVPGVGLFGPTSSKEFGFRIGPHIHINSQNDEMSSIAESEVLDALIKLAKKTL